MVERPCRSLFGLNHSVNLEAKTNMVGRGMGEVSKKIGEVSGKEIEPLFGLDHLVSPGFFCASRFMKKFPKQTTTKETCFLSWFGLVAFFVVVCFEMDLE